MKTILTLTLAVVVGMQLVASGVIEYGYYYDGATYKLHAPSLLLEEMADPPDLALRRFNGTAAYPSPVRPGEIVGAIYGQAWGGRIDGAYGWDPGRGSPYYGRLGQIQWRAIGEQTGESRGGQTELTTTPVGSTVTRARTYWTPDGRLVHLGQAALEAYRQPGQTEESVSALWPAQQFARATGMTVYANRSDLHGPAFSLCYTPDFCLDFDMDPSIGSIRVYRVVSGQRTEVARW